jgi:putative ABC transport system permease protein
LLKVIAHRPVQAAVIAALSALVTACAVLTPLYQRALDQASAQVQLDHAPGASSGLALTSSGALPSTYGGPGQPVRALTPSELEHSVPGPMRRLFGQATPALTVDLTMPRDAPRPSDGPLVWREGACAHLELTSGQCPSDVRQIAISEADAANFDWQIGSQIRVLEAQPQGALETPRAMTLTVTGIYRSPTGDYWDGWHLTGQSGTKPERVVYHDSWVTAQQAFVTPPTWRNPTSHADLPLKRAAVGVDELLRLGPDVAAFQREQSRRSPYVALVRVTSGLPGLAESVQEARDQSRVTIPALMVPLGVLGLVVLWMALGAAVEQRRPELAVARLRGRGVRGAHAHLLRELLVVVLVGVPIGFLVALGLSWPLRQLLPVAVPFEIRLPVLFALLISVVAVTAPTVLVSAGISREPIVALLRRVPARRSGWGLGTTDAVVATAALSILAAFVTGQLTGPIALAAPAVLALAAGLVLARLLIPLATRAGRRLLSRGSTGLGVALLQLGRRSGGRGTIAVLTVAAGILVFAGDAVVVGARNRDLAAAQQVGAPMVATVSGRSLRALEHALAAADLPARAATPVVFQPAVSSQDQARLYVDRKTFADIATFPDRDAARHAMQRLSPPRVAPIEVTGSQLSVRVHTEKFYDGTEQPVSIGAQLLTKDGTLVSVPLGELATGTSAPRDLTAPIACTTGCVLTGWKVSTEPGNGGSGAIVLGPVSTDTATAVPLGGPHDWPRSEVDGAVIEATSGDADTLAISVDNPGSSELTLVHGWVPTRLPAIVTGTLPPDNHGAHFTGAGLDGVARPMTAVSRLPWLPALGANASITDLGLAARSGAALGDDADVQVWFREESPDALAAVRKALAAADMSITHVARVSEARGLFADSAATWSLELGVLVGVACLVVALLGLAIAAAGSWRLRARDLAILRLNGVTTGDVRRISVGEQVPVVVLAVVTGAAGGIVAAHYALPTLPLLANDPQVDLIDLSTAWPAVALLTAGAAAVLAGFGWAIAVQLARRATPDRVTGTP